MVFIPILVYTAILSPFVLSILMHGFVYDVALLVYQTQLLFVIWNLDWKMESIIVVAQSEQKSKVQQELRGLSFPRAEMVLYQET